MVEDVNTLLRLLGPVELIGHDAVPVVVSAPKRRCVLAALALELNRVVPVERLVDVLWDGEPPPRARTALQGHVSALRKVLHPRMRLVTRDPGYVLLADRDTVDVYRFHDRVAEAAADADDESAAALLRDALDLWRGPVLSDVPSEQLRLAVSGNLEEARVDAVVALAERLLRLGRGAELINDLTELAHLYPL